MPPWRPAARSSASSRNGSSRASWPIPALTELRDRRDPPRAQGRHGRARRRVHRAARRTRHAGGTRRGRVVGAAPAPRQAHRPARRGRLLALAARRGWITRSGRGSSRRPTAGCSWMPRTWTVCWRRSPAGHRPPADGTWSSPDPPDGVSRSGSTRVSGSPSAWVSATAADRRRAAGTAWRPPPGSPRRPG